MPLISIITINLNKARGLQQTIESVVRQSFTDYEYIIIDGGSTDGSLQIINEFAHKITYWSSEPDKGIYNAMNKGIKKANGTYLLFLNSGDVLYNSDVLLSFSSPGFTEDIVYGNCAFLTGTGYRIQKFPAQLTFYWLFKEYLCHPSTFIKLQLFDKVGNYNEKLKIVSDWEFFILAVGKYNASVHYLDTVVASVEECGISSAANNQPLVRNERMLVLKNHFPYFYSDYLALDRYMQNVFAARVKRLLKRFLGR